MELELKSGRPESMEGRLEKEIRVYDLLDEIGIPFDIVEHEAVSTMEACLGIDKILGIRMCKNLFLCNRQKTQFYMVMMPDGKPFKTKEVSAQIGCSRLSFAKADAMEEHLDITPGAVSIMGLMNDKENKVQLLVDEELLDEEYLGCHPCVNTASIRLKTEDAFGKFLEAVNHKMVVVKLVGEE